VARNSIAFRTKSDVPADPEIRQHGIANAATAVDQIGGAAHPDTERPVDPVHFDDGFVLVRQQGKRQLVFFRETSREIPGICGLMPTTRIPAR
jgi:hypothetical protein